MVNSSKNRQACLNKLTCLSWGHDGIQARPRPRHPARAGLPAVRRGAARELSAAGVDALGRSDGYVFRALAERPCTVSELAARLQISKQGAAQIVAETLADQLEGSFHIDEENVITNCSSVVPPPVQTLNPVCLSPVSTFIQGAKDGRFGYIVSSIAKHWGVIVGDSEQTLYHLVFEDQADAVSNTKPDSLSGRVRAVKFSSIDWDPSRASPSSLKYVGETRFAHNELLRIGKRHQARPIYQ